MPVQNTLSWADRIATANEAKTKFEAVPLGRFDFYIKQADVVQGPKGEYIKYRAAISSGERANALVFEQCYPNAEKIGYFLEFWHALGFNDEWFMTGNGPTTDQIAAAILNRPFSAEVYVRDDAKDDKNGDKYRSLRKFNPYTGGESAPVDQAPVQSGNFGAPAATVPAAAPVAAAPVATTAGGSPWGAPVAAPVAVPEPTAPAPVAQAAPTASPWDGQAAAAPAASATGAPPNPFA